MNSEEKGTLERLAALSLERCLVKLSKVSAGTWQQAGSDRWSGTLADAIEHYDFRGRPAAAVCVDVKGAVSLASFLLFDPEDMDCISKCFLGYSFPRSRSVSQSEEVMLLELGNIILNALCNSVMNALRAGFLPSVPRFVAGDPGFVAEALGAVVDAKQNFSTIAVTLVMRSGNEESRCKVFLLVPVDLARQLEGLAV
jgi:hypothetical protein